MRLIGYGFWDAEDRIRTGYWPLAELSVLVGPNGAGKTTLMRMLNSELAATTESHEATLIPGEETWRFAQEVELYAVLSAAELEALLRDADPIWKEDQAIRDARDLSDRLAKRAPHPLGPEWDPDRLCSG